MDNTTLALTDRLSANGSTRRSSPIPTMSPTGRPSSLMDTHNQSVYVVQVVVNRDERGYGMKVSGDNPVYVQSVKEGGAAEKAGLHAGDKIIKVNDVNVISSKHTEVVDLIRSSSQVVLTVQQRTGSQKVMASPSVHNRPLTTPSRITGPQPVDNEKQYQLQLEKEQHYRLMIEKEQRYIDLLRSQIASSPDEKKYSELSKTEKNLQTLQTMLLRSQNESPNPTHHRTKSSPESLSTLSSADASRRLIASESMNDLRQDGWDPADTPPGTPPPPYPSPPSSRRRPYGSNECGDNLFDETVGDCSSPDMSPFRLGSTNRILANSSPIHAATPQTTQQPIISMEDDEISDQESGQLEDHGHFKSLSRLWERLPHLAVFMNYILSNSDPNSLLFYLLTDLYKEGNAKEMRKWAFEIHSCFLVPGAPLRLGNVDENIAREIDDVLTREFDKEEILRKIFWKARSRAKEELTRQLVDFQQKRTAGLGTIFGPTDQVLSEIYNDKTKEAKLYESLFLEKLEPFLEEIEKENYDPKRYYTAAALTTVLTRIFTIRPNSHAIDRCPTFVNKEKSFRTKFIGRYSRKLNVQGHQYVAQHYYTVIVCNNCHQIIYGIGPQGYQCSVCLINLHRLCVKLYDDTCPGPINKKDHRGLGKFIRMRHENNDHRRKHSSHFILMERRQAEDKDNSFDLNESGETKPSQPVSRSGSDRRPDIVREETPKSAEGTTSVDHGHNKQESDTSTPDHHVASFPSTNKKRTSSNINRSESVKEQSEKRKQRRNISDPSHNTTSGDVDLDQPGLSNTDSGSSSNSSISYNGRLSESPSNSVDVVTTDAGGGGDRKPGSDWESEPEMDPSNWQKLFPEEELRNLQPHEKKRQDVINELFHTENSHVRNLRVLCDIFYKSLKESMLLKPDEMSLIFPNIKEMLTVHMQFNKDMKKRRKEDPLVSNLGDMLVNMFGGMAGESLQKAAAVFCRRQQVALEFIKEKRKKDAKFEALLVECEKRRQCRRLPLQGIIPTEMQRLSKYPLLLERLISSVEGDTSPHAQEELAKLRRAHHLSKEILNYVNEAAKVAYNESRLEDIQRHLDTTNFERSDHPITQEFRTVDLTRYKLIREGNMQLRRGNKPTVPVHVLLLEEAVIILHKEGDRFLLKFFQSGSTTQPQPLSPIIKMSTLLVRNNAACKKALFLVNTSTNGTQMYDLLADDDMNRDVWFKHFSDAADAHNQKEGKTKRPEPQPDSDESETLQEIPSTRDVSERAETVGGTDNPFQDEEEDEQAFSDAQEEGSTESKEVASSSEGGGVHTKVTADEWPLIQPSQVHVEVPPVHTAESRLTPLEQIRRKDEEVRRALEDKEGLVADFLSIPREHFHLIADMASDIQETRPSKDLSERVLAAVYQVDQLHLAVNEALNVTEATAISATGGKHLACQSQEVLVPTVLPPSIPASRVKDVANSLSTQLTTLLSDVKQAQEEHDRLRKELFRMRERLHEQQMLHGPNEDNVSHSPNLEPQPDLDSIKESPAEPES